MLIKYNNSLLTHAPFYDGVNNTYTYLSKTPYDTILYSSIVSTSEYATFSFSTILNNKVFVTVVAKKMNGGHYFSTYYNKLWNVLDYQPLNLIPIIIKIIKFINS